MHLIRKCWLNEFEFLWPDQKTEGISGEVENVNEKYKALVEKLDINILFTTCLKLEKQARKIRL